MLFLIAQITRFWTLNATQKIAALYKSPFLKKSRKTARNWPFWTKNAFLTIFMQFFLIFSRTVLCRGLVFFALRSVSQNASFELSKTTFEIFFKYFTIRGVLEQKKRLKKILKKIWKDWTKWNRKMGGRSCFYHKWCFRTRSTVLVWPVWGKVLCEGKCFKLYEFYVDVTCVRESVVWGKVL